MKTLTLAFPAKFQIHARFAMTLLEVVEELRTCQTEWSIKTTYLLGKSNLSHARSVMVTEWFETAGVEDGFFFIDSDHTFTAEDILRVVRQQGDLNCGIYCNRSRDPVCFPLEGHFDERAENIPLKYAATGFLFFKKAALERIHAWMKEHEGLDRVVISDFPNHIESRTIPFFHSIMEPPRADGKRFWLGEDFSFSWRAIQAGLTIRGCVSATLGHEIPYVVFNDKPRRAPKTWGTEFVVYCGPQVVSEEEMKSLCQAPLASGAPCIIYSSRLEGFADPRLQHKRHEEFCAQDTFSTLFLYGSTAFSGAATNQQTKTLLVYIEKRQDQLPSLLLRANQVIVSNFDIYAQMSTLFTRPGQLQVAMGSSIGSLIRMPTPSEYTFKV